jgi:hypothetical protein
MLMLFCLFFCGGGGGGGGGDGDGGVCVYVCMCYWRLKSGPCAY